MLEARIGGLEAKITSWVFSTSLAVSGDENTMVETSPIFKCIKGPYFLDKSLRVLCGKGPPSWCMFPMMGSFHGPGGNFGPETCALGLLRILRNVKMKIRKENRIEKE